jgi:hypothetical protein
MEKKIIFDLPEDTSKAKIILDIFEKFGVKDDVLSPDSKLTIVNIACKNFFSKKITEKDFLELLQTKAGVKKDDAESMLKDLKEQLISFAKEVIIPAETSEQETEPDTAFSLKQPIGVQEALKEPNAIKPAVEKTINNKIAPPKRISKISKPIDEKNKSSATPVKPKGQDKYLEPIE